MSDIIRRVDHTALKFNQASIITLLILAFVLNSPALVGGFLSHFSTFSVGGPLLLACAATAFLGGQGPPRRVADAERTRHSDDAGPGGHCGATQESSAADSHPLIDTSDQPLPGPASTTLRRTTTTRKTHLEATG